MTARDGDSAPQGLTSLELSTIFDNCGIGIAVVKDRRILMVNRTLAALYGASPQELQSRETSFLYSSRREFEEYGRRFYEAIERRGRIVEELPLRDRDGRIRWARITGTPLDREDPSAGAIWVVEDITEQHLLQEEKEQRDAILEVVSNASVSLLKAPSCRELLPHFLEELGRASGLQGCYVARIEGPERDQPRLLAAWQEQLSLELDTDAIERWLKELMGPGMPHLQRGEAARSEKVSLSMEGGDRSGSSVLLPLSVDDELWGVLAMERWKEGLPWSEATLNGFTIAANLLSAALSRERQEQARRIQEFKYSIIVENANSIILRMDPSGRIIFINRFGERFFGHKREELIGRHVVGTLVPKRDSAGRDLEAFIQALVAEPERYAKGENENIKADGSRVWIAWTNTPIRRPDGALEEILSIGHDITQLKEIERQLREASEAKSRFLAQVSHELKTPLNAIIGTVELLAESGLNMEQRKLASTLSTAANTLLLLIDDLLDLARIEAGREEIVEEEFDLLRLLEETISLFRAQLLNKGLNLLFHYSFSIPSPVKGDRRKLGQVLRNLISNAVKFTDQGRIRVQCREVAPGSRGCTVRIEIADTGPGIPEEKLPAIFEPFNQGARPELGHRGGAGLGLSIAKRMVELMGGEIGVESRLGEGARFWVELPLQPAASRASQDQTHAIPPGRGIWVDLEDPEEKELVRSILEQRGARCHLLTPAPGGSQDGNDSVDGPQDVVVITDGARYSMWAERFQAEWIIPVSSRESRDEVSRPNHLLRPILPSALLEAVARAGKPREDDPAQAAPLRREEKTARVLLVEDSELNVEVARTILTRNGHQVTVARDGIEALERLAVEGFDLIVADLQMPRLDGISLASVVRSMERGEELLDPPEGLAPELLEALKTRLRGGHLPMAALTAHTLQDQGSPQWLPLFDAVAQKPVRPADLEALLSRLGFEGLTGGHGPQRYEGSAMEAIKTRLKERLGIPEEELDRFMAISASSIRESLDQGWNALARDDWETLTRSFHTLKSSFSTLGLEEEADVALKAEGWAGLKEPREYGRILKRLEEAARPFSCYLRAG